MESGVILCVLEPMELFSLMPDMNPALSDLDLWMVSVTQGIEQNGYLLNNDILVVEYLAKLHWLKLSETFAVSQKTSIKSTDTCFVSVPGTDLVWCW